ncbi:hypothetical protein [Curtobacterium sp. 9128]|uniref:hypothetical protein n=1 Tax=Curtobacterium sp. 9128 TaxID=1793722 RepID=UPI0011A2A53E|nr:hypothetical protein [Curtobacterium sp. 9128]
MRRVAAAVAAGVVVVALASGCAQQGTPTWSRPTDLATRAAAAGLHDVWGQPLAEHIHTHVTITDGDTPVVIPADIGHSDTRRFAAELHTHDTSGIVHVESPERRDFTLGQFFDEWDVPLSAWGVGGLHGDLTVWVDGHRYYGNPRSIVLRDLGEVDLVVTSIGEAPHRPAAFDWPPQYH